MGDIPNPLLLVKRAGLSRLLPVVGVIKVWRTEYVTIVSITIPVIQTNMAKVVWWPGSPPPPQGSVMDYFAAFSLDTQFFSEVPTEGLVYELEVTLGCFCLS